MISLNDRFEEKRLEDESIYSLINMIQLTSSDMPTYKIENFIAYLTKENIGLDNYEIKISLSSTPLFKRQYSKKQDLVLLKNYLEMHDDTIHFSYKLNNTSWLNFHIYPTVSIYHIAFSYVIFEMIIIAIILLFSWSIWRFNVPLLGLKNTIEKIGADLNLPLLKHKSGPAIIREVSDEISSMQLRIQSLLDTRTKMVAAIAHDLRTPITRLKLIAQFIPEAQAKKIVHNLEEMEHMIASIFTFATIDSAHEKKVKTDIYSLLNSLCEDYSDMGHDVTLKNANKNILIYCSFMALKRALINILDNSIKYGKKATINLLPINPKKLMIIIDDNGPGIPDNELSKVFGAYYRLTKPERNSTDGMGLGLTIAYEIISAHNGSILLENIKPNGLRVKIILPLHE